MSTSWRENLPMTDEDDACIDEGDVVFDNGECYFYGTVEGDRLVIHDFVATDKNLAGARTGVGRRACESLRPYFGEIVASGVGEDPNSVGPFIGQPPFLFWRAMLVEGLVDSIIPTFHDSSIDRGNLFAEHVTPLGIFVPGEGLDRVPRP
jgi:hypothetical protein